MKIPTMNVNYLHWGGVGSQTPLELQFLKPFNLLYNYTQILRLSTYTSRIGLLVFNRIRASISLTSDLLIKLTGVVITILNED